MKKDISVYIEELVCRYPQLKVCREDIIDAYKILENAYEKGNKLLIGGNGGSAADADHIVGELMKSFCKVRNIPDEFREQLRKIAGAEADYFADKLQESLPAISLNNHIALNTAYLNDVDGQLIMAQEVYGYGMSDDVFLAITTSGNSKNVLYAAMVAKAKGLKVIGLTGRDGGKLKSMADVLIVVPEYETYKIQELHLPIYHCICLMLETRFFDE